MRGTRRELLATFLGTAVAAGCRRRAPEASWDVDLAPDFSERAHRYLRPPASAIAGAVTEEVRCRVLVVGGGVTGLVAAWTLGRAGQGDVVVLELADAPGGTSAYGQTEASAYPYAAHYVPAPTDENGDLVALLEEMGLVEGRGPEGIEWAEEALCATPKERVFHNGVWQPGLLPRLGETAAETEELDRFEAEVARWITYRDADGRRAFTLPLAHGSDAPEVRALDELSFAEWLDRHGFRSPRIRWYAEYGCRDDFGASLADTSAYFGLHYLCARTPGPEDESAEFLTWPEGNGRVVKHLVSRVGPARIRTKQVVLQAGPAEGGAAVVAVDGESGVTRRYRAERVIFALPSYVRRHVVPGAPAYAPTYAPWLVGNVHLSRRPRYYGSEVAWDNVIYDSRSLGYVVATHNSGPRVGPTVWTWYLPLIGEAKAEREKLFALDAREASDLVVAELDRTHIGLQAALRRVELRRWGHGMVRPEPGTRFSRDRAQAALPFGPIHFAHTDLSGVALIEEAVFHGVRAAREVLAALGSGA